MGSFITISVAIRALARNKMRAGLTVLGVVIGIAAVTTMVSIGQSATTEVLHDHHAGSAVEVEHSDDVGVVELGSDFCLASESAEGVTSGVVTDPSSDAERPSADTEPIFDEISAPGFGSNIDSEKPLDEVILEYLVDKARDRAADKKQRPARQQRKKG